MLFIFGIPQSVRGETGETLLFVHRNLLIGVKRVPTTLVEQRSCWSGGSSLWKSLLEVLKERLPLMGESSQLVVDLVSVCV